MDGFRFDQIARAVAAGTSRRSVLKGLAATLAAAWLPIGMPRLALAQNTIPLGGQCSALGANSECSQAGGAVVCSDNGIIRDGQFNCCRNAGGACTADFHCCGGAVCLSGTCGGGVSTGGRSLGAECTATSECSQTGGSVVCASNGIAADGARNCCRNTRWRMRKRHSMLREPLLCEWHLWWHLFRHDDVGWIAPGAQCTSSDQCSQSGGATVCADNGYDGDGPLNCCRNEGGACSGGDTALDVAEDSTAWMVSARTTGRVGCRSALNARRPDSAARQRGRRSARRTGSTPTAS